MSMLHNRLRNSVFAYRDNRRSFARRHGSEVVSQVTVSQMMGGQRGVKSLLCDVSEVPPDKGLIVRGIPIMRLVDRLPEEIFWLLMTGELPDQTELADLQEDFEKRSKVPDYAWKVLEALPKDSHPMAAFSLLILALERESEFRKQYNAGMTRDDHWLATLDDSLNLIARLPELAAGVYRWRYDLGKRVPRKKGLDWAANYAHMMGVEDKDGGFTRLVRLYMVLHCDHEGGNVSAHTAHCVASALSDTYYAVSAGLNGLAGPLHGLANQEVLKWLLEVLDKFDGNPTDDQLEQFAHDTLNSGRVIPGYGHAVLRVVDPRFTALLEFGNKECPDAPVFKLAEQVFRVVPKILQRIHKIKDPWPNVDSISGSLLHQYGVTQPRYYTVMFGVSRAMGIVSQVTMSRAAGEPIERPKSITFQTLGELLGERAFESVG